MDYNQWASALRASMQELVRRIIVYLPNVLSAIVLVVVGWLLAWALRFVSSRLISAGLNRLSRNAAFQRSLQRTGLHETIPRVISAIVFWVVLLFFFAAAIEQLDLRVVTLLLSDLAQYLPRVLIGVSVVFVGLLGGNLAYHWVANATSSAGVSYGNALGRITQVAIVLVAIVVAADQVGIQSNFFMLTVAIVAGSTFGAMALAFGLGSGSTVSNIIASYYLNKTYRAGQEIRIGDVRGRILEISPTAVVLQTPEGRVLVPAKRFTEEMSVLLTGG
jgi:small-conductance mechanosensitive channel